MLLGLQAGALAEVRCAEGHIAVWPNVTHPVWSDNDPKMVVQCGPDGQWRNGTTFRPELPDENQFPCLKVTTLLPDEDEEFYGVAAEDIQNDSDAKGWPAMPAFGSGSGRAETVASSVGPPSERPIGNGQEESAAASIVGAFRRVMGSERAAPATGQAGEL